MRCKPCDRNRPGLSGGPCRTRTYDLLIRSRARGHDALCGGFAAVVLGVRRDDHRRGADHHDDHLKPDRHTLTCPKAHPDTPSDTRLKTGYLSSINTGGTSKSLGPLRLNPNQCDEKGRRQGIPPRPTAVSLSKGHRPSGVPASRPACYRLPRRGAAPAARAARPCVLGFRPTDFSVGSGTTGGVLVTLDTLHALHEHDHHFSQTKSPARGRALCCVECDA